jgi:LysW-gamma-L-lysine carboxypeptidase
VRIEQAASGLLEPLVRTPSPSGEEDQAAELLVDHLRRWGLTAYRDDVGNVLAQNPNADSTSPTVLLVGHLDTVPGRIDVRWEGSTLHGRGSVDAKGPLVAHALALATLPADTDLDVHLVAAVGEEATSRGARHIREVLPEPAAYLIAEPTGLSTVGLGYKGRMLADVTVQARPTHPGEPTPTAPERLLDVIDDLTSRTGNPDRDVSFDETTLRVTELASVREAEAERARATIDLRFPDTVPDGAAVVSRLADVGIEVRGAVSGVRADPRNPLATAMRGTLRNNDREPSASVKTGTSDWNVLAERWSCPAIAYGPGEAELDHSPDERIDVTEVAEAAQLLRGCLRRVSG